MGQAGQTGQPFSFPSPVHPISPSCRGVTEAFISRGARFRLWDTGDGFTPDLPGGVDASLLDDIKTHYEGILAELKSRPGLATVSYAGLPSGGRSQRQWDLAQAFADSEWHDHALAAGWTWDELHGDGGVVWDIIPDKVISVSALRFIKIDRYGYAGTIYREGSGHKGHGLAKWSEPIERPRSKPKGYGSLGRPDSDSNPKINSEPTREEFLKAIGYRLDGTHVSDGKAYSK